MRKFLRNYLIPLLIILLAPISVHADAVIVPQAMFASTIVEYFVEDDHVRVELEIGMQDLQAFRNILPESIYARLGNPAVAVEDRLELFFGRDLVIYNG
ncbi:MAG: hypothetical protein V3R65_06790, partial [Acidiferrobacterales bacterium]